MTDRPMDVRAIAPEHAGYWHGLQLEAYAGGPFADRSGGLITFTSDSREHAEAAVAGDPFVANQLVEAMWLKEWAPVEAGLDPAGGPPVTFGAGRD